MSEEKAVIHYHIAISVFRKWLDEDILRNEEFEKIEDLIANKYGLTKGSIYR